MTLIYVAVTSYWSAYKSGCKRAADTGTYWTNFRLKKSKGRRKIIQNVSSFIKNILKNAAPLGIQFWFLKFRPFGQKQRKTLLMIFCINRIYNPIPHGICCTHSFVGGGGGSFWKGLIDQSTFEALWGPNYVPWMKCWQILIERRPSGTIRKKLILS